MTTGSVDAEKRHAPQPSARTIWTAALIVGLTMATGGLALYMGVRMILRELPAGRVVEPAEAVTKSPAGDIRDQQRTHVDEANLGLPVYPRAEKVRSDNSVQVRVDLGNHEVTGTVEAAYQTPDAFSKVRTFYQTSLRSEAKPVETDTSGSVTFEFRRSGQQKLVALKAVNRATRIELIRILQRATQAN
ncbi:MAG TPA: hypothetical protein VKV79_03885 [Terriglobia bacterium]|nr:hypothetical protein [Terriglobia bacterium]